MSGDLESILNGNEQPEAVVEPTAEPEAPIAPEAEAPEAVAEEAKPIRDEKGRFAPKGETTGESPTPETVEPVLDHAALLGERRRRQEAEDRIRELEARFASQPQVQPQPTVQQPTFDEDLYWSNPQAFLDNFKRSILQEVQGVIPQVVTSVTLDRAEAAARTRYEDYDTARNAFYEAAIVNQALGQKALSQPDPAEFAYREGKRLLEMANYGSTNEYIEAEVARRLAAQQPAPAPTIPVSLADAPASGSLGTGSNAPPTLDAILNR